MSNGYNFGQASTLSPEMFAEQQDLNRQQRMAQMLMQQGQQAPQGQMISGRYVAPSIFQNLASLAQTGAGAYLQAKGDEKALDMAKKLREEGKIETQRLMNVLGGTPDTQQVTEMAGPYTGNVPMPTATQTIPGKPGDVRLALAEAMNMTSPQAKALIPTLVQRALPEPVKPTTDMQNYEFAKSTGFKGSFNDFKNQITPYQQAQLGMEREKFEFEKTKSAIKPLPEGLNKQVTGSINLSDAITDYQSKIKGFGVKDFANPDKRAEMGNAYNNMMLQAKEAYNLGVLNGPDYEILQKVVRDPTNPSSLLFTNKALDKQAENLRTTAKNIVNTAYISQGRDVPADVAKKLVKPEITTETKNFSSEQDVQKAIQGGTLKKGDKVTVNGVTGTIQ
jgi:hypothetical protein